MRVIVMHNPGAGRAEYGREELQRLLRRAGHSVTYQSVKDDGYERALEEPADLVIAAGGDGTLGRVVRRLVGRKLPFAILPLGTANNAARTLGFDRSPEELIGGLNSGETEAFDIGRATGPWGERYFFESVGAGLFADYLVETASLVEKLNKAESASRQEEMKTHVSVLRRLLSNYQAREWKMRIDGQECREDFIWWELMNIRSVGPVLTLAPDAKTNDGSFNFVTVKSARRQDLQDLLEERLRGGEAELPVEAREVKKLKMTWDGFPLHIDDKRWGEDDKELMASHDRLITFEILPGALRLFRPV